MWPLLFLISLLCDNKNPGIAKPQKIGCRTTEIGRGEEDPDLDSSHSLFSFYQIWIVSAWVISAVLRNEYACVIFTAIFAPSHPRPHSFAILKLLLETKACPQVWVANHCDGKEWAKTMWLNAALPWRPQKSDSTSNPFIECQTSFSPCV